MKRVLLLAFTVFVQLAAYGQIIRWELSAEPGNQASSNSTAQDPNISTGLLNRGAGVTASGAAGSISSSGWFAGSSATTLADAIANNDYYQFTVPVNAGFKADISEISIVVRSSSTGPNTATVRSSIDGFTSNLGTIPITATAVLNAIPVTINDATGTITFRVYGYGGAAGGGTPSSTGTFRIGSSLVAADNDLFLTGSVMEACNLTGAGLANVECDDNGTPEDATDDLIRFDLNPTGAGLGTGYNVVSNNGTIVYFTTGDPALNVPYGVTTTFYVFPPGSAGNGDVTITIADATDNICTFSALVVDPGPCSCNISGISFSNQSTCFNNDTGDPADDYYTANITITFSNPPATGFLQLEQSGAVLDVVQVPVADLVGNTHTFTNVRLKANGMVNTVEAEFSDLMECVRTAAAPVVSSCSDALACDISDIAFSNQESCNDNGTSTNSADDYYTADITITFVNPPAMGFLQLEQSGAVIENVSVPVADLVGNTHTFVAVKLKANGLVNAVEAEFSDNEACVRTEAAPVVESCSGCANDQVPPEITCPIDLTVSCANNVAPADIEDVVAMDVCSDVTVSFEGEVISNQTCANRYTLTRTYKATDASGNMANCQQIIVVDDQTAPTLNCPFDITVSCSAVPPPATGISGSDNCGGSVTGSFGTQQVILQTGPGCYTLVRTYFGTDACGNVASCQQYLTVFDNIAPEFNVALPEDITVDCDGAIPPAPTLTGTDNCNLGDSPPVIFINEIHYDNVGVDMGEFIEVAGTAGIDLTQYQLILYNGSNGLSYTVSNLSGTIDNEGGSGFGAVSFNFGSNVIQNGAPDGIALVKLPNTVVQFLSYEGTFTALDGPANGILATAIPVLEVGNEPLGLSIQLTGAGQQYADFNWTNPVAQTPGVLNAGQSLSPLPGTLTATLTQMMSMGACAGEQTITRIWTLSDGCGNNTQHTQTLTFDDSTPPTFAPPLPQDITINCQDPIPAVNMFATDNCDPGTPPEVVWINEVHYDNVGTDANEFIEVAGTAGTDLSTYQIHLYNGSDGSLYSPMTLTGVIDNESNGYGAVSFPYPVNGVQNGAPDGIALIHNGMVLYFLSYEGAFTAVGGTANGLLSTDILVFEDGNNAVGTSLRLTGNGNMYNQFAWNMPAPSTPGTLNQGQTMVAFPTSLVVGLTTLETPGACPQEKTVTRTWSVSDACNNSTSHTQIITVVDETGPTVSCQNVTIELNICGGEVTVNSSQIPYSAVDNCAASTALTLLPASITFDCTDDGTTQPFVISVQDPCGNIGVCTTQITIPVQNRCTPQISSEGCVCLNNATTLENGQFSEKIYIRSLSCRVWTITQSTGFYSSNSPSPPSAPLTALGLQFVESPANSGDYYLTGIHVDAQGYSITVVSQYGEVLTISNECRYPNPVILSNLDGPFCLYSDPVELIGDPGDANIISAGFTINGVPATVFDPGALGIGAYVIEYTVDGGVPKAFGPNDPGCIQKVQKFVNVLATPSNLACNDLVHISLDDDCETEILPDMILEGTYFCFDDYAVNITTVVGNLPVGTTVNGSHIGQTLKVTVKHLVSGNTCWGLIKVEDKLEPVIECNDITVTCAVTDYSPQYLDQVLGIENAYPEVEENCDVYELTFVDTWFDLDCDDVINGRQDMSAYVRRVWTAIDPSGNSDNCTQFIYFERRHVSDVIFPTDITISCEDGNTDPSNTGAPYVTDFGINWPVYPLTNFCEMNAGYTDQYLPVCDGTYKILRTWIVLDWCMPTSPYPPQNPMYFIQTINVMDNSGPVFTCPAPVTVSTDPFNCCATVDLPDFIATDNCSRLDNANARVLVFDQYTGLQIAVHDVAGSLSDFPGNNHWNRDTMVNMGYTPCLPIGTHRVIYSVTDNCGNSNTCSFNLRVEDQTVPNVSCDEFTQVALGADGMAFVNAETFDDGSYDNCADVYFKVRRMDSNGCQTNSQFHDQVKFCCEDVGDTIMVVLRVWDVTVDAGSVSTTYKEADANDCMVQVFVEDKIKPTCVSPANVTVSCENFDPSLWSYGIPDIADNCCLDSSKVYQNQIGLTHTVSYTNFDTVCNKGTLVRTFRAFDCYGNSSQCTQRVVVNYEQDYWVKFPNDVIVTTCDGTGNYGEPLINGEDCEQMGISFEDEIFTVVPDACFKIERTWHIINWCTYNANLPCIYVPNPNPHPTVNHPTNLPGPTVSPAGTPAPWAPTVVKVNPSDPMATNYSIFWDANANCYEYKQIIKIIDTQDPVVDCPASPVEICDLTANDAQLWNQMYWWDAVTGSHDLCEAPTDLTITATDACSGSNLNFRYLLFLDLDGDATMETVISSTNLPGWNNVNFDNIGNPNYGGGTPRAFDFRPVPANQQYGFALQTTVSGNNKTASVRWNTQAAQNSFVIPELPYGTHKIKWFIEDGCGNETICEYTFEVKDCKKPTVVCINGLSVNIMQTGMITLWASDFLQYMEDNCTPTNLLKLGIVESDESTGVFPTDGAGNPQTSVTFDCTELGGQPVQLWAMDLAGNADFCETYVLVQDNMGICTGDQILVAGALKTELAEGLEESNVELDGSHPAFPPINMFDLSDNTGSYLFSNALPFQSNYTVTPTNDNNPLNGVTTFDLVLMSKHILGVEPLNTPYKLIAADINKSSSVTTYDVVELRKLVLGVYTELPNNTSWRFADKSFTFADPQNPWIFPETKTVANVLSHQFAEDFVAIKIGDLNGSALANSLMSADDRTTGTLLFDVEDRSVTAGEEFTVHFKAAEKVLGYQFTLNFKGLEVVDLVPGAEMTKENFGVFADAITTSFDGNTAGAFAVKFRATSAGRLSQMLGVSSRITKSEAYTDSRERLEVALRYDGKTIAGVGFELYQNAPNPFINKTFIGFHLPEATEATLTIFDETGRMLFTQTGDFAKGYNAIAIDKAQLNATGVLYYKVETATASATKKMIQTK